MAWSSLSPATCEAEWLREECSSLFSDLLANQTEESVTLLRLPVVGTHRDHSSLGAKERAKSSSAPVTKSDVFPECFGHTSVLTKNKDRIICYGGRNAFEYFGDIWEYHISSSTWTKITLETAHDAEGENSSVLPFSSSSSPHAPERSNTIWPTPRTAHSAAMVDQKMFVLCGEIGSHAFSRKLWFWDVEQRVWGIECASVPFPPRKGHTMHYLPHQNTLGRSSNDMLIVFGGIFLDGCCTNEVLLYTFSTKCWSRLQVKGEIPRPRGYHVSQMLSSAPFLLVFGGQGQASEQGTGQCSPGTENVEISSPGRVEYFNCLSLLDVSRGVWKRIVTTNTPSPRSCACSVFENEELAVFCGGANGSYATDILQLHCSFIRLDRGEIQGTWKTLDLKGTPQCSCSTVVYANGQLLMFGGIFEKRKVQSNFFSISLGRLFLANACKLFELQARRKEKARRTMAHLSLQMEKDNPLRLDKE